MTGALVSMSVGFTAQADNAAAVSAVFNNYQSGTSGLGKLAVKNVKIDDSAKTIKVDLNEVGGYLHLDKERTADFKNDLKTALVGKDKADDYTIKVDVVKSSNSGEVYRYELDDLYLFAPKKYVTPSETKRFFTDHGRATAPEGLEGKNLALWQSHGWYFEPKLNRWEWQRARVFQTVEDLYTQSYVMPFLMPMLENAGATVMSPRERDTNLVEIIADNDGAFAEGLYRETGKWTPADKPGFAFKTESFKTNQNPFREGTARLAEAGSDATAAWSAKFPKAGEYAVYVSYLSTPESADEVTYTVNSLEGKREFTLNQKMGGGTWIYLGHFPFKAGEPELPVVELTAKNAKGGKVVSADAVKIGGGMGNVARKVEVPLDSIDYDYVLSGYPRFTEGARYFLQYAGAPDSVYTPTGNIKDYNDDYMSRGLWVNWLAGGSSVLPEREGLNIPVDLAFAFHSDAGTTMNDSIIGTLGIYCTDGRQRGDVYANGMSRNASRDLTDLVVTNIVNDVRAKFEPNWTRRGMWNSAYYEARVPEVPTMLLELLSHQNFADMKYGLDPEFRFTVSRAIYKGMLQFLAHRDGREYVVTPLAVNSFAINGSNGEYTLSWKETVDSLEATAKPTYYIIEERIGDGAFVKVAETKEPVYKVKVKDSDVHSYRVIAANRGGVSFPGEVLALCNMPGKPVVNIVNGFTRVSAPDWFDSGEIAGFYDVRDHGVPYVQDISFIGSQFEFRRDIPWMDDDAAGFGASRANYEDKVIAGNTFDFVYTHGTAIREAGYGFVSTSVDAFVNAPVEAQPKTVDLILGKQKEIARGRGAYGTAYKTFPSALQDKIAAHTAAGGDIFVSGSYVATDLWDNPFSSPEVAKADQDFARNILGYNWRVGQASVTGEAYTVASRFKALKPACDFDFSNELNSDLYAVESPDSFYPADDKKTATFLRYTENNLIAGTAMDNGKYRSLVIGFPFETITKENQRNELMKMVLDFFKGKSAKTTQAKLPAKTKKKK